MASQRPHFNDCGSALTELALILPIFSLLLLGALDASRVLSLHQAISSVSREAAQLAYRSCVIALDEDTPISTIEDCFSTKLETVKLLTESERKGYDITLSAFRCNFHICTDNCVGTGAASGQLGALFLNGCQSCECDRLDLDYSQVVGAGEVVKPVESFLVPLANQAQSRYWAEGEPQYDQLLEHLDSQGIAVVAEVSAPNPVLLRIFNSEKAYESAIY